MKLTGDNTEKYISFKYVHWRVGGNIESNPSIETEDAENGNPLSVGKEFSISSKEGTSTSRSVSTSTEFHCEIRGE